MAFSGYQFLNPTFAHRLKAFVDASGGRITIFSGHRSMQRQAELYAAAVKKYGSEEAARRWVAPPGKSNHNKGMAADLRFADKAARQWAHANAVRFGLHFPMGHEPWHVELVGARGATEGHTQSPTAGSVRMVDRLMEEIASGKVTYDPAAVKDTPAHHTGGLEAFMRAIRAKESGGNYGARNKDSGAFGAYQFMPATWASAAREAGVNPNDRSQQAQDRVAGKLMMKYFQMFGNWRDVAIAWYGGPGAVKYSNSAKTRKQGKYPSINSYADDVVRRMGSVEGPPAPDAAAPQPAAPEDRLGATMRNMVAILDDPTGGGDPFAGGHAEVM